uniref:Uncharacterized protein n=1 Tax=Ficus carica TaxID=3494 RepID=A0AA87ZDF7_FICCA|nr:hypothetical protein TIFTF001_044524 [Ficus carica]GMN30949.1 hypothetical protein TIFTF001_044530 [Ficus carica]
MVELWYLDTFSKVFAQDGEIRTTAPGAVHKYLRTSILNHFGSKRLKDNLLLQIEDFVNKTLSAWSTQASVEVKIAASAMVLDFTTKIMISYDAKTSPVSLSQIYCGIVKGFLSFPLNNFGTAYHQCLKRFGTFSGPEQDYDHLEGFAKGEAYIVARDA